MTVSVKLQYYLGTGVNNQSASLYSVEAGILKQVCSEKIIL